MTSRSAGPSLLLAIFVAFGCANILAAEKPDATGAADSQTNAGKETAPAAPIGFLERDTLTGDWGGARLALRDAGLSINATEIGEILGAAHSHGRNGAIYEGRLEADLDIDLETLFGLGDAVVHANAYQIHGRGVSGNYLGGNLLTASNIEATRATRLFDLWLQKGFYADALSLRVGQIAADDEFLTSQYAGTLINATFGSPRSAFAQRPGPPSSAPRYPQDDRDRRADQQRRHDRDIEPEAVALDHDVAGQPSQAEPCNERPCQTDQHHRDPDSDQKARQREHSQFCRICP